MVWFDRPVYWGGYLICSAHDCATVFVLKLYMNPIVGVHLTDR